MRRWIGFAVGFLAFLGAHEIEVLEWTAWFGGVYSPWFLNSGAAIVFTLGWVCAASGITALLSTPARPVRGIAIAAGAFVAMTLVMFLKEGGPGTIFPIVMVAGGTFLLISSTLGALAGRELRRAVKGR